MSTEGPTCLTATDMRAHDAVRSAYARARAKLDVANAFMGARGRGFAVLSQLQGIDARVEQIRKLDVGDRELLERHITEERRRLMEDYVPMITEAMTVAPLYFETLAMNLRPE